MKNCPSCGKYPGGPKVPDWVRYRDLDRTYYVAERVDGDSGKAQVVCRECNFHGPEVEVTPNLDPDDYMSDDFINVSNDTERAKVVDAWNALDRPFAGSGSDASLSF